MKNNDYKPSSELDNVKLGTAAEERLRAKAWMDTAAFHAGNEEYWHKRTIQLVEQQTKTNNRLKKVFDRVRSIFRR